MGSAVQTQSEGPGLPPLLKNPPDVNRTIPLIHKTLTIEEHRARSAKRLCFNCDEAYMPGHRCKGRMFRLDAELGGLVEMCEEPSDLEENAELVTAEEGATEISLQTLSGSFNPRTLRLKGSVKGHRLTILIDCGSTHNFVHDTIVFIGSREYLVCLLSSALVCPRGGIDC